MPARTNLAGPLVLALVLAFAAVSAGRAEDPLAEPVFPRVTAWIEDGSTHEIVRVRQMLVPTEDEAKAIIAQLDRGADFTAMAKEHSENRGGSSGVEFSNLFREQLPLEFADAAFSIPVGQYSKTPVHTKFGWHVILVEDRRMVRPHEVEEATLIPGSAFGGEAGKEATDIVDLLAQHKLEAKVTGSGIERVVVLLHKITAGSLVVGFPVGLYFAAGHPSAQNMVGTDGGVVPVTGDRWVAVPVPAACANLYRGIPSGVDSFSIRRLPQQEELAIVLSALALARAPYPVIQAAIWILTDDANYDALGVLVRRVGSETRTTRVIRGEEAGLALRMMAGAGVNVTKRSIWRDRRRIASGVKEENLARWLLAPPSGIAGSTEPTEKSPQATERKKSK
jgi:hypothetical protein